MWSGRRRAAAAAFLAAVSTAPSALADGFPKIYDSWFLPVGVSGAYAIHKQASDGFAGGLELSLVHDSEFSWQGAYVDLVRDFAADRTRVSLGPEIGVGFLGIDGGYLLDTGHGYTRHGFCVRPMFTLGVAMLYARLGELYGVERESVGEIGILLKFPVLLHEGVNPHRPIYEPPEPPDARPPDAAEPPPSGAPLAPAPAPGPFAEPPPGSR